MTVVHLQGGLGNQLFQLAVGLYVRLIYDQEVAYDVSSFSTDRYGREFAINCLGPLHLVHEKPESTAHLFAGGLRQRLRAIRDLSVRRDWLHYVDDNRNQVPRLRPERNYYLEGYWQTTRFLDHVAPTFLPTLRGLIESVPSAVPDTMRPTVSVHVRRADYIADPRARSKYGDICTDRYYRDAMEHLRDRLDDPVFCFFTDDPVWVASHYLELSQEHVLLGDGRPEDPWYDLANMARCDHHIMANSSYSWWAANIRPSSDKVVVAPNKWTNNGEIKVSSLVRNNWFLL